MNQLSPNGFKAVIDIDVLGSFNTVKATLPYLVKSAEAHRVDGVSGMYGFSKIVSSTCLRSNRR